MNILNYHMLCTSKFVFLKIFCQKKYFVLILSVIFGGVHMIKNSATITSSLSLSLYLFNKCINQIWIHLEGELEDIYDSDLSLVANRFPLEAV